MKKLLLSIFTLSLVFQGFSQCIPDGNTNGALAYPIPANAAGGSPMDTISGATTSVFPDVVQFKLPSDTVLSGLTATIDSIWIESIANFPAGTQYTCNTPNCKWAGGTNGCVTFLNTTAGSGIIEVQINLKVKGTAFGNSLTIPQSLYYKFDAATVGIDEVLNLNGFTMIQNMPNPFSEKTTIKFSSPNSVNTQFEVHNLLGQTVFTEAIKANPGINTIEFNGSNLPNGTYLFSINNGKSTITGKMNISK
jgi:hypothetical protein